MFTYVFIALISYIVGHAIGASKMHNKTLNKDDFKDDNNQIIGYK